MKSILVLLVFFLMIFPVFAFSGENHTAAIKVMDEIDKRNLHTLQITFILSRHMNNKFLYMASMAMGLRGEKFMHDSWNDLKNIDQKLDNCGKLIFQLEKNFSGEKMDLISDALYEVYLKHKKILKKLKNASKQAPA